MINKGMNREDTLDLAVAMGLAMNATQRTPRATHLRTRPVDGTSP